MTRGTQKPPKEAVNTSEILAEKKIEAERMRDVLLLLQNLVNSQEATVKLVLDCLYDIGSVNLINQKFRCRPLNRVIKSIARMSKPAFKIYALHWFKKNCPQLIANWLQSQVAFESVKNQPQEIAITASEIQPYSPAQVESLSREIKQLRSQVRWLTGISIVAIAALGVTITGLNLTAAIAPLQLKDQMRSAKIESCNYLRDCSGN